MTRKALKTLVHILEASPFYWLWTVRQRLDMIHEMDTRYHLK